MNHVNIIGTLGKDVDLRYTSGKEQVAVANLSIAVSDGYGESQRTYWIDIVAWGKTAENCEKYLAKGSKIAVEGSLVTNTWEYEGKNIKQTKVKANKIEFLTTKKKDDAAQAPNFEEVQEDLPF